MIISRRFYPTDFVHGLLSSHCYCKAVEGTEVIFKDKNKEKYNQYLTGWKVYKVFNPEDKSDYYGVLYIHEEVKQLVLAHRGTDIINSLLLRNESLKASLHEISNKNIDKQQSAAFEFSKESVRYIKELSNGTDNYRFSITGHSLGGWLAGLSTYFCYTDFGYPQIKAVTFDSPGIGDHLKDVYDSNIDNANKVDIHRLDITTYLSAPNIVNSCNTHIGRVYRLYPKIKFPKQLQIGYLKKLDFINTRHSNISSLLAVSGHGLDPILECFDPDNGKAIRLGEVRRWPVIEYKVKENSLKKVADSAANMLIPAGRPKILAKGVSYMLSKIVPKNTMSAVATIFASVLNGDTRLTQLFETYKGLDIKDHEKGFNEQKDLGTVGEFNLTYKGHYKVVETDLKTRKIVKYSDEWQLEKLHHLSKPTIEKAYPDSAEQLLALKGKYRINNEGELVSHSEDIDDLLNRLRCLRESDALIQKTPFTNLKYKQVVPEKLPLCSSYLFNDEVKYYVDRPDANERLNNILNKEKKCAVIAASPGLGKSTLAKDYAQKLEKTLLPE